MYRSYYIPRRLAELLFVALCMVAMLPAYLAAQTFVVAQTTVTLPIDISDWTQLVPVLITALLPMLLGMFKKFILIEVKEPDGTVVKVLPNWFPKWLPLMIAPVLIWGSDLLMQWLGGGPGLSPILLALLSPLPSYLRDIGDQIKKAKTGASTQVVQLVAVNPERVGLPPQ